MVMKTNNNEYYLTQNLLSKNLNRFFVSLSVFAQVNLSRIKMPNKKCLIFVFVGVFVSGSFATNGSSSSGKSKSLWPIKFPANNNGKKIYYSMERLPEKKFEEASAFAVKHLKIKTGMHMYFKIFRKNNIYFNK